MQKTLVYSLPYCKISAIVAVITIITVHGIQMQVLAQTAGVFPASLLSSIYTWAKVNVFKMLVTFIVFKHLSYIWSLEMVSKPRASSKQQEILGLPFPTLNLGFCVC